LPNCWRPIFLVLPKLYGCQVGLPKCITLKGLKSFFMSFSLPIPFLVVSELLFSRYDQWEWGCSKKNSETDSSGKIVFADTKCSRMHSNIHRGKLSWTASIFQKQ
jgi:hypothetical protein